MKLYTCESAGGVEALAQRAAQSVKKIGAGAARLFIVKPLRRPAQRSICAPILVTLVTFILFEFAATSWLQGYLASYVWLPLWLPTTAHKRTSR